MHFIGGQRLHINWYILLSAVLSMALSMLFGNSKNDGNLAIFSLIHIPIITILPIVIYILTEKPSSFSLGINRLQKRFIYPVLCISPGVWGISQAFGSFVETVLGRYGINAPKQVDIPITFTQAVLGFVAVCVIAPICEELFYRGVVLYSFKDFGVGAAVVSSAVLFAIAHYNPSLSAVALIFGIFTGYAVISTGSILAGILLHALCNTISYIFMLLKDAWGWDFNGYLIYMLLALTLPFGIKGLGFHRNAPKGAFMKGLVYLVFNIPFVLIVFLYIISIPFGK